MSAIKASRLFLSIARTSCPGLSSHSNHQHFTFHSFREELLIHHDRGFQFREAHRIYRSLRIVLVAKGIPSPRSFLPRKKSMATWSWYVMVMSPSPGILFRKKRIQNPEIPKMRVFSGFGTLSCKHNVEDDGNVIIFLKYEPLLWLYLRGRALKSFNCLKQWPSRHGGFNKNPTQMHPCLTGSQVIFSRHRTSHAYSRNRVDSKNPPSNRLTQEALPSCAVHVHFAGPIGMLLSQDTFFQVSECFIFHHPLLFEKLRKNHRQTITYKSTKETPTTDWPSTVHPWSTSVSSSEEREVSPKGRGFPLFWIRFNDFDEKKFIVQNLNKKQHDVVFGGGVLWLVQFLCW